LHRGPNQARRASSRSKVACPRPGKTQHAGLPPWPRGLARSGPQPLGWPSHGAWPRRAGACTACLTLFHGLASGEPTIAQTGAGYPGEVHYLSRVDPARFGGLSRTERRWWREGAELTGKNGIPAVQRSGKLLRDPAQMGGG
jgi:hypothetical protein